tara:strand:+ start:693 stop:812 length:120 start_codon:yes stop_codon:yes gene_type:complete
MWTMGHALLFLLIGLCASVGLFVLLGKLEQHNEKDREQK